MSQDELSYQKQEKYNQLTSLLNVAFEMYYSKSCQCAFPRYLQISGIDCTKSGDSYMCYETDLLISMSKNFFDIYESERKDEVTNEKWICKKCKSVFEFGWSDFSIHVNKQKLVLVDLKANHQGKSIETPIPLYLGLIGHSYPSQNEMSPVEYDDFEKYILEK